MPFSHLTRELFWMRTIMSIAGHVSREMLNHSSHIRMNAKREALELLDGNVKSVVIPKPAEQARPN